MSLPRLAAMLAVVALAGVAIGGMAARAVPNGVRFFAVESGSMAPFMKTGDLVVDVPITPDTKLVVGDVITFHPTPGYTTTHRIVSIDAAGIQTKGDANPSADVGQIPAKSVVGRVIAVIPFFGYVATFFRQPAGIAALVLVMVALYLAWDLTGDGSPKGSGRPSGAARQQPASPNPAPVWPASLGDREWRAPRDRGSP